MFEVETSQILGVGTLPYSLKVSLSITDVLVTYACMYVLLINVHVNM